MLPEPAIDVADLVKHYRASDGSVVHAVDGVSLNVFPGEIVGLLGANGAGKTSTLRVIATLLSPTAGTACVAGCDVRLDAICVRRQLGYVSATTGVPDRLTPREILYSFGRLHGIHNDELGERVEWLLELLDLSACADRPAGRLVRATAASVARPRHRPRSASLSARRTDQRPRCCGLSGFARFSHTASGGGASNPALHTPLA